jgi:hypothetical protein
LKDLLLIAILFGFYGHVEALGQVNDSIYSSWWENKGTSLFNDINEGQFRGTATGSFSLVTLENDTFDIDFQSSTVLLDVEMDSLEMYDNSTKHYATKATNGTTSLTYEIYALANILTISKSGEDYSIGIIDGASDTPIFGLSFNYSNNTLNEDLSLSVTEPLTLTTTRHLMRTQRSTYPEALKMAKTLTILPGSKLTLTVEK